MSQNYVLVQRALTVGATIFNSEGQMSIQNVSEFTSYLNETYLSQGYEIKEIHPVPLVGEAPVGTVQYAYHLVRNLPDAKVAK
jgi:hypothetical protein